MTDALGAGPAGGCRRSDAEPAWRNKAGARAATLADGCGHVLPAGSAQLRTCPRRLTNRRLRWAPEDAFEVSERPSCGEADAAAGCPADRGAGEGPRTGFPSETRGATPRSVAVEPEGAWGGDRGGCPARCRVLGGGRGLHPLDARQPQRSPALPAVPKPPLLWRAAVGRNLLVESTPGLFDGAVV